MKKDLGVIISAKMKVSEQCNIAAKKGNMKLGFIRRHICNRDKSLIIHIYKATVRQDLEYFIQAWRLHLRKYIDLIERVQRRAMKLIPEFRSLSYEDRLKKV